MLLSSPYQSRLSHAPVDPSIVHNTGVIASMIYLDLSTTFTSTTLHANYPHIRAHGDLGSLRRGGQGKRRVTFFGDRDAVRLPTLVNLSEAAEASCLRLAAELKVRGRLAYVSKHGKQRHALDWMIKVQVTSNTPYLREYPPKRPSWAPAICPLFPA
jgi:hypothetical protein